MKIYQIDAFTDRLFAGNPAAVCILEEWLSDDLMQSIAAENNLAETAFVIPYQDNFAIRWFTPTVEVALCGHATLASAYVLFHVLHYPKKEVIFQSLQSGELSVNQSDDLLFLNFPTDTLVQVDAFDLLGACIGITPKETYKGKTDYIAVLHQESDVSELLPDFGKIAQLDARGLIVTAPGKEVDFVSRFFAPQSGVDEDPVTGSAHTSLIPLWAKKLGKDEMKAKQLSKRGGEIICKYQANRCLIGGKAKLYLVGDIWIK